jgi:hypothetical protein
MKQLIIFFILSEHQPFKNHYSGTGWRQHARWKLNALNEVCNQNRSVDLIVEGYRGGNGCNVLAI